MERKRQVFVITFNSVRLLDDAYAAYLTCNSLNAHLTIGRSRYQPREMKNVIVPSIEIKLNNGDAERNCQASLARRGNLAESFWGNGRCMCVHLPPARRGQILLPIDRDHSCCQRLCMLSCTVMVLR